MKSHHFIKSYLCALLVCITVQVFTQNVSAVLDLTSTSEGFLPPRMTAAQRDSIKVPAEGMLVFNQTSGHINYFDGYDSAWIELRPANPEKDVVEYFSTLPQGIQLLLDAGETPANLLSLGISAAEIIGKIYQGGHIFYLDSVGRGLVVSPADQSNAISWGCDGIQVDGAEGANIGSGLQNSLDIENSCTGQSAAKTCLNLSFNGYRDWYLPSRDELNLIWQTLVDSDGDGNNIGPTDPNNIGGFGIGIYWSSTQLDDTQAHFQSFSSGFQNTDGKDSLHSIRAIRAF